MSEYSRYYGDKLPECDECEAEAVWEIDYPWFSSRLCDSHCPDDAPAKKRLLLVRQTDADIALAERGWR